MHPLTFKCEMRCRLWGCILPQDAASGAMACSDTAPSSEARWAWNATLAFEVPLLTHYFEYLKYTQILMN